jgi:hypothetical protein
MNLVFLWRGPSKYTSHIADAQYMLPLGPNPHILSRNHNSTQEIPLKAHRQRFPSFSSEEGQEEKEKWRTVCL